MSRISYNFNFLIPSSLGECWANLNKDVNSTALYNKYGSSGNCFNMEHNDFEDKPKRCLSYTGKHDTNYIYRIRNNSRKSYYYRVVFMSLSNVYDEAYCKNS